MKSLRMSIVLLLTTCVILSSFGDNFSSLLCHLLPLQICTETFVRKEEPGKAAVRDKRVCVKCPKCGAKKLK